MIIQYYLAGATHTALVPTEGAAFIEKLRGIGAKHFTQYKMACYCDAGVRVIDEEGTTEPCTQCELGREYEALYNPNSVIPF